MDGEAKVLMALVSATITAILVFLMSGCASLKRDPQLAYYRNYCFYETKGVDRDTAAYWKQLCAMSKQAE